MRNEIAALHAMTSSYKRKLSAARGVIRKAVALDLSGYVSLSGGKDSTVVYSLVRELQPSIHAVWSDDEWWLPETLEYIQRLQAAGLPVHQIRTQTRHTEWFACHGEHKDLQHYTIDNGWQLCYLGLRQEESSVRRMHLRTYGPLFYAQGHQYWHCNPIHDWTWRDVWAYLVSNQVDYNQAYDRLEEMGIEPERQRIGPLATEKVLRMGQLAILKRGWPDLFNRFAAAHPEALNYV